MQAHLAPARSLRHVEALVELLLKNNKIRAAAHPTIMAYRIEQGAQGTFLQVGACRPFRRCAGSGVGGRPAGGRVGWASELGRASARGLSACRALHRGLHLTSPTHACMHAHTPS